VKADGLPEETRHKPQAIDELEYILALFVKGFFTA